MNLPPDFWTKPEAFGMTGLIVGLAIGFALGFRLFRGGGYLSWQYGVHGFLIIVLGLIGMFVGEFLRMFWLGYL